MSKKSNKGSLLTGLLAKVDESNKIRSTITLPKKDVNRFVELENRIRQYIQKFDDDINVTKLALEPMTKDERYRVHDIVTNEYHDTLVSLSEGDQDDRHVVIYRKGHQTIETGVAIVTNIKVNNNTSKKNDPIAPVAPMQSFVKLNVSKRDRRTVEEIQLDMKAKKSKVDNNTNEDDDKV